MFLKEHKDIKEGQFYICGYDPMNMIKTDDIILCSHFIMLQNEELMEPFLIQGPVLLHMKKGSTNEVVSYTK